MSLFRESVLAFTGHRPHKLAGVEAEVKLAIRAALHDLKPTTCISGMALGVDTWAAEACVELGIPFIAAVPFEGQDAVWPLDAQTRYRELLRSAAKVHVVSKGGFTRAKFLARNRWMVDHAQTVLAIWNGDPAGGTGACVRYAREQTKKRRDLTIYVVDPAADFRTYWLA